MRQTASFSCVAYRSGLLRLANHVTTVNPDPVVMDNAPVARDPHPATTLDDIVRSMNVVRSIIHRDHDTGRRRGWPHYHWSTTACPEQNAQQGRNI